MIENEKKKISGAAIQRLVLRSFNMGYKAALFHQADQKQQAIDFIKSINLKKAITDEHYFE